MFGVNQAECCSGDTGDCLPTSTIASVGARNVNEETAKKR